MGPGLVYGPRVSGIPKIGAHHCRIDWGREGSTSSHHCVSHLVLRTGHLCSDVDADPEPTRGPRAAVSTIAPTYAVTRKRRVRCAPGVLRCRERFSNRAGPEATILMRLNVSSTLANPSVNFVTSDSYSLTVGCLPPWNRWRISSIVLKVELAAFPKSVYAGCRWPRRNSNDDFAFSWSICTSKLSRALTICFDALSELKRAAVMVPAIPTSPVMNVVAIVTCRLI